VSESPSLLGNGSSPKHTVCHSFQQSLSPAGETGCLFASIKHFRFGYPSIVNPGGIPRLLKGNFSAVVSRLYDILSKVQSALRGCRLVCVLGIGVCVGRRGHIALFMSKVQTYLLCRLLGGLK
jgi:hypothetical protein